MYSDVVLSRHQIFLQPIPAAFSRIESQCTRIFSVNWNLLAKDFLQMFNVTKYAIAKGFDGCIVIIVMMKFPQKFFNRKHTLKFPGVFANIFQYKIISVYSR